MLMLVMLVTAAFFSFQIIYERTHRLVGHNPLKLSGQHRMYESKKIKEKRTQIQQTANVEQSSGFLFGQSTEPDRANEQWAIGYG